MRATWVAIGVVVGLGAVAYLKVRERAVALAKPAAAATKPAESRSTPAPSPAPAPSAEVKAPVAAGPAADPAEARARALRAQIADRRAAHDAAGAAAAEKALESEAWDADEARRHALERGWEAWLAARGGRDVGAVDRARRDLSRGVYLPEMFDAQGASTPRRKEVLEAIAAANERVMTQAGGLPGVVEPYVVQRGDTPLRVVSRQKRPYGYNAFLQWRRGGLADTTLRAGETLLLPVEPLTVEVRCDRHLLAIFLGGVFVKEFAVGCGKAGTPTPRGTFEVGPKYENPDWWTPDHRKIPYGHPDNELGSVWIPLSGPDLPVEKGIGIHGTNKPETVGTDCSNGCVRLRNAEATEVSWWVRSGRGEGPATRVTIR
jgi:lipoprotein-anchoring transpeptidase ErfK/SrfK